MLKKHSLARILLAVVLVFCFALPIMPSEGTRAAALSNTKVQKKLQKKIKNKQCKYAFADIDKDGTDELIAMFVSGKFDEKGDDTEKNLVVFKYKKGKVSEMLRLNLDTTGLYDSVEFKVYYSDTCYLEIIENDYFIKEDMVYKLSDGTFSKICNMIYEAYEMLYLKEYYIGEEKVSKKKYTEFTKPLLKNNIKLEVKQSDSKVLKKYVKAKLKAALAFNMENDWKGWDVKTSYSDVFFDDGIDELVVTVDPDTKYVLYINPDSDSLWVECEKLVNQTVPEDVTEYVSKHYPKLLELADKGYFSFSTEYKKNAEKDYIRLGSWNMSYWDYDNDVYVTEPEKTELEWEVLAYSEDGKSALVISKNIIEERQYNTKLKNVTWETCSLRKWLNKDFYKTAFTEKERSLITPVIHENVEDKVFLLSDEEVEEYFIEDAERSKDENRTATYKNGETGCWWLRSMGVSYNGGDPDYSPLYLNAKYALYVDYGGDYEPWGESFKVNYSTGVRPVFRIKLTDEIIKENNLTPGNMEVLSQLLVKFGSYNIQKEDDPMDYKLEDLEWQILDYDEKNNRVMLLSKYIVEMGEYNEKNKKITWDKSPLREWLNGYFYYDAFSTYERALIKLTNIKNNKNPIYGTDGGKDTKDHIFLLSLEELEKYFHVDFSSEQHYKALDCYRYDGELEWWWLRSPGVGYQNDYYKMAAVYEYVDVEGRHVDDLMMGIRPVMYIDLN